MLSSTVDCPHAATCSGCPLIALPYLEQLRHKQETLQSALERYPTLAQLQVGQIAPASAVEGYRVRAKLVCSGRKLGLYGHSNHEVIDVPGCKVLTARVAAAVDSVRQLLPFEFRLLALDVREVDAGVLVTLIVPPDASEANVQARARQLVAAQPNIVGVAVSRRAVDAPQVLGSSPISILGVSSAPHHLSRSEPYHEAVPGGFVQAHPAQASALYGAIQRELSERLGELRGARILELYAGAGSLALSLAARGAHLIAVEQFEPNLQRAARAAREQGLHVTTHAQSAETALAQPGLNGIDAVIVDPPRRGLSPTVRSAIAKLRPKLMLYVACDPRSFARDLAHLARAGLEPLKISGWDMIPLSDAVEALAVLAPCVPAPPRVLHEDADCLIVDRPGLWQPAEHAVLPRSNRASGVCVLTKARNGAGALVQSLQHARAEYVALVQGITHKKGRIQRKLRGAELRDTAELSYIRERAVSTHSFVRASLHGQGEEAVRQLFASIRHPVLGDARHGHPRSNRYFEERHYLDREFLHCSALELTLQGKPRRFESPLPPELEIVLSSLETESTRPQQPSVQRQ